MSFLDFLFPKRCLGCGRVGQYFCEDCRSKLSLVENQICPECERPAISGATHPGCKKRFNLDGLISFCYFEGPIKEAIHKLKYRLVYDLGEELVDVLLTTSAGRMMTDSPAVRDKFTIVPVPLHPGRLKWRGFNQAVVLGEVLNKKLGLGMMDNLLQRTKNTRPQVELRGAERKKNMESVFAVSPNIVISQYPNILLLDDMWTTGATLRNCARVLKRAGAKDVWGLTVARNR